MSDSIKILKKLLNIEKEIISRIEGSLILLANAIDEELIKSSLITIEQFENKIKELVKIELKENKSLPKDIKKKEQNNMAQETRLIRVLEQLKQYVHDNHKEQATITLDAIDKVLNELKQIIKEESEYIS